MTDFVTRDVRDGIPLREVAHADAEYVLRWLEQSEAPSNIIGLQRRAVAALAPQPCRVCRGLGVIDGFWLGTVKTCPACHGEALARV